MIRLINILNTCGIDTQELSRKDIILSIWTKGVVNCSLNALSALYLSKMNLLIKHLYIEKIINTIIDETHNVEIKYNVNFNIEDIKAMLKKAPNNYSSIHKNNIQNTLPCINIFYKLYIKYTIWTAQINL